MKLASKMIVALIVLAPIAEAQYADSSRGVRVLRERGCLNCHSLAGAGGSEAAAPDLGRPRADTFSPAGFAAGLWNHSPDMWAAMADRDGQISDLSAQDVRDVYSFLYSIRYFDPPGRHERGKEVFESLHCQRCHAIVGADVAGIGPPVAAWPSMTDPVAFLEAMWNHGDVMDEETSAMGYPWPKLTVWDLADLSAYVENVPVTAARAARLKLGPPEAGMKVFADLSCSACHTLTGEAPDKIALLQRVRDRRTLTALAASMWNHRPVMREWSEETGIPLRAFETGQMANLLSYLFEEGVLEARGDAGRGEQVFQTKGCGGCHSEGAAALPDGDPSGSEIVSGMWRHGPKMRAEVIRQGGEWPQLSDRDLTDLITWLAGR